MAVAEATRHSANISTSEYIPDTRLLKYVCRFEYGESLADETRIEGPVPIMGSNGQFATHTTANTGSPVIIVGRKGSFGKLTWSDQPVFAIDTTFYIDASCTRANLRWLYYALQTLHLDSSSQDAAVPGLNREDAYSKHLVVPSLEQQGTIAVYLDRETARIDDLIAAKERLLDVLTEKRQALIIQAITRGLDPTVSLKDSGIAWLGKIPTHWNVVKLSLLAEKMGSGTTPPTDTVRWYEDGTIPWVTTAELRELPISSTLKHVNEHALQMFSSLQVFPPGTVLIAMYGATIGRVGYLTVPACMNQACCAIICGHRLLKEYLFFYLQAIQHHLVTLSSGGGQPNISQEKVAALRVNLPPISEQKNISFYINFNNVIIDDTIKKVQKAIDALIIRRMAVINSAIVGTTISEGAKWR